LLLALCLWVLDIETFLGCFVDLSLTAKAASGVNSASIKLANKNVIILFFNVLILLKIIACNLYISMIT
jgi:hypothetical protein